MIIGKVGRPHGLRGAFFVAGRDTPIPSAYRELRIGLTPDAARVASIGATHMQGDRPVLVCSLAADRTGAEALTGHWIYVEAARAHKGEDAGELLWGELPDAEVVDCTGLSMGRVVHVYNAGASDVIEVRDALGRSLDIPLVDDYVSGGVSAGGAPSGRQLRLTVSADVFADLWLVPRGLPGPGDA